MSDAADLLHNIIAALAPPTAGTRTKARAQQRAQDLLATALREAHEAGRREGIEEAAKWHDGQARREEQSPTDNYQDWALTGERHETHRRSASALRALAQEGREG